MALSSAAIDAVVCSSSSNAAVGSNSTTPLLSALRARSERVAAMTTAEMKYSVATIAPLMTAHRAGANSDPPQDPALNRRSHAGNP